jgi:tRNA nucleotidyltransferase/poly(A) polymerase
MLEIKEPDWKVLRRVHPLALERFCERVLAEIDRVLRNGAPSPHARYLQIFRILQQRDREMARLFDNPRRSHALTMLAQIRSQGLLTEDEFSSLSPEKRATIQMLLGAG